MATDSATVKKKFTDCDDFQMRPLLLGGNKKKAVQLCYLDGIASGDSVGSEIVRAVMQEETLGKLDSEKACEYLAAGGAYNYAPHLCEDSDQVADDIINGYCAVIFDDIKKAVTFEVKNNNRRSVEQPTIEKSIKGSKDAFVETLRTNTTLLRRKIRSPNLKSREIEVGMRTNTKVAVIYYEGITNTDMVNETLRRLSRINIDGVLETANIEEYIADNPHTPFPQMIITERTDKFCINILEGRVGILVDGIPMGMLAPGTFAHFLKVPEDNANHFIVASVLTVLRYFSLLISLLLPAIYVAIAVHHQEMVPTKLLLSIIESKVDVPFSTSAEVIGMLVAFELLQEAGLRLPTPVGEAVSIIGALIVGQSAVEAKVISPVVVIVVAVAGIAGYTMPNQDMAYAIRLARFAMVIAALVAGMFGIAAGIVILVYHLSTLESFGVPYMTPFSAQGFLEKTKAVLRWPLYKLKTRESALNTADKQNQE